LPLAHERSRPLNDIPEEYLEQLRARGLLVIRAFPSTHLGYPNGCLIGKPVGLSGNSYPGFERSLLTDLDDQGNTIDGPLVDGPTLILFKQGPKYFVALEEGIGGHLPYDFVDEWENADKAIADVLAFYFGDSSRFRKFIEWHEGHN
jgi:hypothetical protein